jgi:predicted TIM-barrel fold metal-dependent hydrolase
MENNSRDHSSLAQGLRQRIGEIGLVDAHEHLLTEEQWLANKSGYWDLLNYVGYSAYDMVSAGMPTKALDPALSQAETWEYMRPFWPHVRNMGPGILCRRALAMFAGVQDLNDEAMPAIQKSLAALRQPGAFGRLMAQYGIEVCVNISPLTPAQTYGDQAIPAYFAPLLFTTPLAWVQKRSDIARLEEATGCTIYSLKTYLGAVETLLERQRQRGFVGIKWHTLAYVRDIHYPLPDENAAARGLDRILRMPAEGGHGAETPVGFDEMRPFQDLVQHYLVQYASEVGWPVQIHTGIFGRSYGAQVSHANPTHLVDLFLRYPKVRFDILHASYPYMRELTALVKMFANVRINTAWLDILAPRAAKQYLREWTSSVPINKIHAFAADQGSILSSCAYAEMVRDNLAEVLAGEVADGSLSEDEAMHIAARWLHDNAWEFFGLQERWGNR